MNDSKKDPCVLSIPESDMKDLVAKHGLFNAYFNGTHGQNKLKLLTKAYYFYETGDFVTAMVYSAMSLWISKVDQNRSVGGVENKLGVKITELYRAAHDKYIDQVKSAYSNKEDSLKLNILDTETITDVSGQPLNFSNVVGMNTEKQLLRTKFIFPNMFPYLYTTDRNNVLMYGPPGTGKTFIAKASSIEFNNSGGPKVIFIEASASELRSKWEGGTEKNIKELWVNAQAEVDRLSGETNRPHKAILFLDEIEALASDRTEFPENSRAVTTLLQVMDGISSSSTKDVMVMAATNLPWVLDPAILRRLPGKIMVGLPDFQPRVALITDAIIQKFYKDTYNQTNGTQFRRRLRNAKLVRVGQEDNEVDDLDSDDSPFRCGNEPNAQESFDCYLALLDKLRRGLTMPGTLYKSEMKRAFDVVETKLEEGLMNDQGEFKENLNEAQQEQKAELLRIRTNYNLLRGNNVYYDIECDFMNPRYFTNPSRFQTIEQDARGKFEEVLSTYREQWDTDAVAGTSHFARLDGYFKLFAKYHFGVDDNDGLILLVKYIHYLGEQTGPKIGTRIWTHSFGSPIQSYKTSRFAKRDFGYSNSDISNFMNDFYGKMALDIIQSSFVGSGRCAALCKSVELKDCNIKKNKCWKKDDGGAQFSTTTQSPMDAMFLSEDDGDIFVTYKESMFDSTMSDFFPTITPGILDVWKFAADGTAPSKKNDVDSLLVKQWNRSKVF